MVTGDLLPRIGNSDGNEKPDTRSDSDRVRLIALDLDGTVLSPTGHVSPRTRQAIRRLIEAGVNVCIATGRSWWESRRVIEESELEGPGIFAGGAIVNEMSNGHSIAHTRVDPLIARQVVHQIEHADVAAMVLQDPAHADVEWLLSAEHEMPPTVPEWLAHHGSTYRRVEGLKSAAHDWTVRVGTVTRTEAQGAVIAKSLAAALGPRVYLHQITVPTTGISVLEVFDAAVNKWSGIQRVAGLLGVDERSVIAIGDDMNDLPMLRQAGLGVAMGNARPEVKAAAHHVIGSNADDGLAVYLEELIDTNGLVTSARLRRNR